MNKKLIELILTLSFLNVCCVLNAATTVLPPSVALRTEVSYVNVAKLESITVEEADESNLSFKLIKNLHNQADEVTKITVSEALSRRLMIGAEYIIAYEKVKKIRKNESKYYVGIDKGPTLMQVQGAYPAIFGNHPLLVKQLSQSPQLSQLDVAELLEGIFEGISVTDPVVKNFFVREVVNWPALQSHLEQKHYQLLYAAFISADASIDTQTAILELRSNLHQGIGVEKISLYVKDILRTKTVHLNPFEEDPALVLHALEFVKRYDLAEWDMVSRWTRTNIPTIAEQALLILQSIDALEFQVLVQQRLDESLLDEATRRVLSRFRFNKPM